MDSKYFEEIKARDKLAFEGDHDNLEQLIGIHKSTYENLCASQNDVKALIAEVERLAEENKKLFESYRESNLAQAEENYELEKENATLKKALEIASEEVNTAFETLVEHHVMIWERKASNIQDNIGTWIQKAQQAKQTHETQEAEK